jgi:hypothetical protein
MLVFNLCSTVQLRIHSANLFQQDIRSATYVTEDLATTASQNGFSTNKLSLHKKTDIIPKMTENV